MDALPVCPNCHAELDLTRSNPIQPVIYRHVSCRRCGTICVLEGPQANVVRPPPA
jgi:hypothetical protein